MSRRGELQGMEALLRWQHPELGLLPSGKFSALAEEIGVAAQIGRWMLKAACKEAARWPGAVQVAISISSVQFEDAALVATVDQALQSVALKPERVELEITEAVLLRNEAHVMRKLRELKNLGVRIGMKEFGTGYASLSRLVSFPFDRIRIDQSVAGAAPTEPASRALVSAVAALGASLGVHTMIEGVVSHEHLEMVRGAGAASVRGLLSSDPVPCDAVLDLLEGQNKRWDEGER